MRASIWQQESFDFSSSIGNNMSLSIAAAQHHAAARKIFPIPAKQFGCENLSQADYY